MMNGVDFIMKIIYGSGNKGKLQEVKELFKNNKIDVEILSLKDINFDEEIEENGETFEENSLIKEKAAWELSKTWTLADDSGLCIDALHGNPGIYSARFLGEDTSYDIKNQYIIQ